MGDAIWELMPLPIIVVLMLASGIYTAVFATRKGRDPILWFFAGAVLYAWALSYLRKLPDKNGERVIPNKAEGNSMWQCLRCNVRNHPSRSKCLGCGAPRVHSASRPEGE